MKEQMLEKCTIAVDAMGGDYAPLNVLLGSIDAMQEDHNFNLILVGDKKIIMNTAKAENINIDENLIHHSSQVIDMSDTPTTAIKQKPDSSIVVGAKLVKKLMPLLVPVIPGL